MSSLDYWKSLEELAKDPEFEAVRGREFSQTPEEYDPQDEADRKSGVTRREFLRLMGASLVMASAAACVRRPVEKLVPYLNKPEEITPGVANWYASTCGECPAACGILTKNREGRPIKLEGNPDHPMSKGGLCARGQASLLNLYDPDRMKGPVKSAPLGLWTATDWKEADRHFRTLLKQVGEKKGKIRLLTGNIVGPATQKLINDFLGRFENARQVVFEPLSLEELSRAQELCYGEAIIPSYRIEKAGYILSFGADFLDTWLSPVEFTNRFAQNRKLKNAKMSRFVCFESHTSVTGSNADIRYAVRPGEELKIALALANELKAFNSPHTVETVARETGVPAEALRNIARELRNHKGESLVLGGGFSEKGEYGLALHVAANLLNSTLQNDGVTVDAANPSHQGGGSYEAIGNLVQEMASGEIDLLLIYKSNPAYTLPSAFGFEAALKKVPNVAGFADRVDETAVLAGWVLPDNHYLESWGDAEPQKGLFSLFQPAIAPLYNTRSFQETLLAWSGASDASWHDYLQNYWKENVYTKISTLSSFNAFWESALRDGVLDTRKGGGRGARSFKMTALAWFDNFITTGHPEPVEGSLKLILYSPIGQYDGRSGNNSWLKELPDPITKVTWNSYVALSPATAARLEMRQGDILRVKTEQFEADLPLYVQPGMPKDVAMIPLGFGRTRAGEVGNNVGVNGFGFVAREGNLVSFAPPVTLTKTGEWYAFATTQHHNTMEGRPIAREATLDDFIKNPKAGNEENLHLPSMWSGHKYEGHRWGMAIDLNSCTGCSACMIACQAENNIPVVGEKQVRISREMHWIRIDRYYHGDAENPEVLNQPMLCQHCENAPCETVCPVVATVHSDEGLNMQIYNRCVGTRYCSNNCPYKVRRFNWFEYLRGTKSPLALVLNPDVTVREKGVMEKCTFCVQRIQEGKDHAQDLGRKVADGEIKTACQQSCPSEAIVFGDLNDPSSKVSKLRENPRGYNVLAELNVKPSITYLTKIRNKG